MVFIPCKTSSAITLMRAWVVLATSSANYWDSSITGWACDITGAIKSRPFLQLVHEDMRCVKVSINIVETQEMDVLEHSVGSI